MRVFFLLVFLCVAPSVSAAQESRTSSLAFNGHRLGDTVSSIRERKREGRCEGKGKTLTECTIFDAAGIAYYFYDGHIINIEVDSHVSTTVALPFGIHIGNDMGKVFKLSFPKSGEKASVAHDAKGVTLTRMIREPGAEYDFELQLHFNNHGVLDRVIYKDIL